MRTTATKTRPLRGFSLIELLVVLAGISVALGLSVGLIHSLLKLDRISHAHLAETSSLGRLAHQFRQDVRASERVKSREKSDEKEAPARLELSLADDRTVEYEARAGAVSRIERRGEEIERRERFRINSRGMPRIATREENDDVWVVLTLAGDSRTPALGSGPGRAVRIEALLGKDRRLAHLGETAR